MANNGNSCGIALYGRTVITTSATEITDDNIRQELEKSLKVHGKNKVEINYLYEYYKGHQPILERTKDVREEICNKIVENRANEIVSFKTGYLCGEPIQYVARRSEESIANDISILNELMFSENKSTKDKEIVEWGHICGTAYRIILPDMIGDEDDAPFELYTLDPRDAYVVYSRALGNLPLYAVKYYTDDDNIEHMSVYTKNHYWELIGDKITISQPMSLGYLPIIEYPANSTRMGAFEIVLPLLNALNNIESNRMDGIEQFVQSFMEFKNVDITADDYDILRQKGAIKYSTPDGKDGSINVISTELNQTQVQTAKEDIYNAILDICGMPSRNGNGSTSDTGAAVIMRDGWSQAEARAKDSETIFKQSEKEMLKVALHICQISEHLNLKLKDIDIKFTRRNYEAIQSKSQVLCEMLGTGKIAPQLAFESCGMFSDPEYAYLMSKQYVEEQTEKAINIAQNSNESQLEASQEESDDSEQEIADNSKKQIK